MDSDNTRLYFPKNRQNYIKTITIAIRKLQTLRK